MNTTTVTWEETTTFCDHCGGRILRRNDGRANGVCLQCERCRCQWTLENRPLRPGSQPVCKTAQRAQADALYRASRSRRVVPPLVVLVLFIIVLIYAGPTAIMQALPGLLGAFAALAVVSFGHDRHWW